MSRRGPLVRAVAPFVAVVVTVGVLAFVAGAHDTDLTDPNDTKGKLDVRKVRLAHQPGPPVWTIVTFGEWSARELWDRGYVMVILDTRYGPPEEYYVLVRSNGSGLGGTLWRVRAAGPDSHMGTVAVNRRSSRSVSIHVTLGRLTFGEHRRFYRWWVQTIVTSDICPRTCQDRAPNGDASVLNWRPGMSPSPSPSPSETP